jgi:hypothetical protein
MKQVLIALILWPCILQAQKSQKTVAPIKKVTVFKEGAQIEHQQQLNLSTGKHILVFEKLTDFLDPTSIQLKSSVNAVILSIRTRKNYDDKSLAESQLEAMNAKKKDLEKEEQKLRDEYRVLLFDEQLLMKNNDLGSQQQAVKMTELKEASTFFHTKLTEINTRKSQLQTEIEIVVRKINTIEQEISTRQSLPVINYTEIEVELDVQKAGDVDFAFSYITSEASWTPYYDMRSNGIGSEVLLEAKANVTQNTGIEWKNIQLVLSTNDPYDNTQEPKIDPWYVDYYTPAPRKQVTNRYIPEYNFDGELIHGQVSDYQTGEPLAFAKITLNNQPDQIYTSDASGRFSFIVPKGERGYTVSYLGYQSVAVSINSPYTKIQLIAEEIAMETIQNQNGAGWGDGQGVQYNATVAASEQRLYSTNADLQEVAIIRGSRRRSKAMLKKLDVSKMPARSAAGVASYSTSIAEQSEKDLRMEFTINTPFTIPSDNADHKVAIAVYTMPASYEYHTVPKLDPSVYLVAQISGWEKLNLLSGESNIYFDGTFIGKSYVDVEATKDTISFSLGKDKKVVVERKRSEEMSKTRLIGSRYKYDVTWDFTIRNNGSATIPVIMKDHFPISVNSDIKVKQGTYEGGTLEESTGILTWRFSISKGEVKKYQFNYSVDYGKEQPVYLE